MQRSVIVGKEKELPLSAPKKRRIWELDFLRGVCVLLMIFDHAMYDVAYQFGRAWADATKSEFFIALYQRAREYWASPLRLTTQDIVVWTFALLCGISCSFSKNNFRRAVEVAAFAGIITLVTTAMGESTSITFGILHMFAVAIFLWVIINEICGRNKYKTAIVCLVVGIAIILIDYYCGIRYEADRQAFADDGTFFWLARWMQGGATNVHSADYYPVFPTAGYMLLGAAIAPVLYPKKRSLLPRLGEYDWHRPFDFWGRIAIWVYVLHQVVIMVIFALISFIFITPGDFIVI